MIKTFTPEEELIHLQRWFQGNESAVNLVKMIGEVSQIADDFVDGDIEDGENATAAMVRFIHLTMVEIPRNTFYIRWSAELLPLFITSPVLWGVSDVWQKSDNKITNMFGYVYREVAEQIITMVAYLIGGTEHSRKVTKQFHEFYHDDQESLEQWKGGD